MRPLFTIHAGEYLVGEYLERTYPKWNVWIPSKDTGIDLLVTDANNQKTVSIQVKFSKDFSPVQGSIGWWTHDPAKIQKSKADFWVFVLPSFLDKKTNYIILPPGELLRRFKAIHGMGGKRIQSYLRVTKKKRCWESRGLNKADRGLIDIDQFSDMDRDFTQYLNSWKQIERKLK